ncbi:rhomboid family intramembrane serine protease [Corynebacterium frankenforstense]
MQDQSSGGPDFASQEGPGQLGQPGPGGNPVPGRPGPPGPVDIVRRWFRDVPVTTGITAAMLAVWLVCALQARSITATGSAPLARAWMLWGPEFLTGFGPLRAVGFMFVHMDASHVLLNGLMTLFIGREIERAYGSGGFAAAWLVSGLGSALAVLMLDPLAPTGGASGAVYGLMAVLVGLAGRNKADLRAPLALVGVNIVYTLIAANVSLWGHLGGLAAGAVVALLLVTRRPRTRRAGLVAALAAVVAALAGYVVTGGY